MCVLDLSQIAAGPYGTSLMGDLSADARRAEPPEAGSARDLDDAFGAGQGGYFYGSNRSGRPVALELTSTGGYAALTRLVSTADVVVVAFPPGALKRLRVDYDSLRELNPRLIYVSITALGETGPRAYQPGIDILAQALSGMIGIYRQGGGDPVEVGVPIADLDRGVPGRPRHAGRAIATRAYGRRRQDHHQPGRRADGGVSECRKSP
jgi:formyl-CoA transferase